MKYSAVALSALARLLVGRCSDQEAKKPASPNSKAASQFKRISHFKGFTATIKGTTSEVDGGCVVDIVNDLVKDEVISINRAVGINIFGWAIGQKSASVALRSHFVSTQGIKKIAGR